MEWDIEFTDEFGEWWDALTSGEQESVRASVKLLGDLGPRLPFPHSSGVTNSQRGNMRELRIQHAGRPYRVALCLRPSPMRDFADRWGKNRKGSLVRRIRAHC